MKKPTYNYTDWYEGKVYLETGAILKNNSDNPIKATLNDFSIINSKKIQLKQKEIFDTKSFEKLNLFKKLFNERFKNSESKELLLKQEIEDNKKILYLNPAQELHFKNRSCRISKDDLAVMREYINTQMVKGEKYYGFVHSPNFKFAYENYTNVLVYARVTFCYHNWLLKFQDTNNKSISRKDNSLSSKHHDSKAEKIKVKVIALIYLYNGQPINRINCDEIAAKYNYIEIKSGEGLYQDYLKFSTINGRTKVNDESKIRCNNRLKLIEKAINLLKGKAKEHAKKDYHILSDAIEKHEW